ncbi:uncharacterized protein LOC106662039 [Cimex lectularius]|uniref:Uncharacterized protein n=1 Tax=Cimex lectularius TaxID=79782 RepID=A0A8I6R8Q9_CIMLE|nr:uncharacterized protein LOC106662039 [Cimex lectularius]
MMRNIYYLPGSKCMTLQTKTFYKNTQEEICVIAPKSLERPLKYVQYVDRGTDNLMPPYPNAVFSGNLRELPNTCGQCGICFRGETCSPSSAHGTSGGKDTGGYTCGGGDTNACCHRKKRKRLNKNSFPYCVNDNVFIEHHGRFMKAPKELLMNSEYKTRTCYLEDPWSINVNSLLDLSIMLQKICTYIGRVMIGFLGGVCLVELLLVMSYMTKSEYEKFYEYYVIYSTMSNQIHDLLYVLMTITLISLFDWLDLGHCDSRHLTDSFRFRKLTYLTCIYVMSFLILLSLESVCNHISFKYDNDISKSISRMEVETDKELLESVDVFNSMSVTKDAILLLAYMGLVSTMTDDLFLLHLMSLKKYQTTDRDHFYEISKYSADPLCTSLLSGVN